MIVSIKVEKAIWQNSTSIYNKKKNPFRKLGIE